MKNVFLKQGLEYIDEKYQKRIKGVADIDNFMLGTLLNNTQFGNLSVNADIDLLLQGKDMSGAIKMAFPTFYFNNYDYKNITCRGPKTYENWHKISFL